MKKRLITVMGAVAVCVMLSIVGNVLAQDVNQPKDVPVEPNKQAPKETPKEPPNEAPKEQAKEKNLIIGILTIVKDTDGNVAEMMITAHKDLKYKVVIDEKSKEMAKSFADKRVRAEGFVETKGDVKWLTVETYGDSKPKPDARSGAKRKAKPAAKPASKSRK